MQPVYKLKNIAIGKTVGGEAIGGITEQKAYLLMVG